MIRFISAAVLAIAVFPAFGQVGIGVGPSMLKAFGYKKMYYGLHLTGEFPSDDQASFYGRLAFYAKNKGQNGTVNVEAKDFTTNPSVMTVNAYRTFNYMTLEGGRRLYFGNGYDYGFSAYGGSHLLLALNQIKMETSGFDESKYRLPAGYDSKGSIFNFGIGLEGGLKNTFAFGTLYFDISFCYLFNAVPSNQTAADAYTQEFGSPLLFTFNVGYRKEIF